MNAFFQLMWMVVLWMMVQHILKKVGLLRTNTPKDNGHRPDKTEEKRNLAEEIRTHRESIVDMVEVECCKVYMPEDQAYLIIDGPGKTHYFCSWECREKYLLEHSRLKAS